MSDLTREDVDKAIASIEDSKKTHVLWRDRLNEDPAFSAVEVPTVQAAGDINHHEQCIDEYNHVLKVLNTLRALLGR